VVWHTACAARTPKNIINTNTNTNSDHFIDGNQRQNNFYHYS
jgi:hypothetical protein